MPPDFAQLNSAYMTAAAAAMFLHAQLNEHNNSTSFSIKWNNLWGKVNFAAKTTATRKTNSYFSIFAIERTLNFLHSHSKLE